MVSDLTPVELKILRHYSTGWPGGALVTDPDSAIPRFIQSFRGGTSLWQDGPWYQTTAQGIEVQQDSSGETIAVLRWSRIKEWVQDLPRAERDALCAAETVYRQRLQVERIDAAVDFANAPLSRRRVPLLDDAGNPAAGPHDAPVAIRPVDCGCHHSGCGFGATVGFHELPQGGGTEKRHVA